MVKFLPILFKDREEREECLLGSEIYSSCRQVLIILLALVGIITEAATEFNFLSFLFKFEQKMQRHGIGCKLTLCLILC